MSQISDHDVDRAVIEALGADGPAVEKLRERVISRSHSTDQAVRQHASPRRSRGSATLVFALVGVLAVSGVAAANPGGVTDSVLSRIGVLDGTTDAASEPGAGDAADAFARTNLGQSTPSSLSAPSIDNEGQLNESSGRRVLSFADAGTELQLYLAKTSKQKVCFAGVLSGASKGGVSGCFDAFLPDVPFTVVNQMPTSEPALLVVIAGDEIRSIQIRSTTGLHDAQQGDNAFAWHASSATDEPSQVIATLTDGSTVTHELETGQAREDALIEECREARDYDQDSSLICLKQVREGDYPSA